MVNYQFPSNPEYLNSIEKWVDDYMKNYTVVKGIRQRVLVASLEAVSNAIHHGNKKNFEKKINFVLEKQNDYLKVVVEDEGTGFDYTNIPDPTLTENVLKLDGRGIYFMTKLSDKIDFIGRGNRVELYFKL